MDVFYSGLRIVLFMLYRYIFTYLIAVGILYYIVKLIIRMYIRYKYNSETKAVVEYKEYTGIGRLQKVFVYIFPVIMYIFVSQTINYLI